MSTLDARRDALAVHAGEPSLQALVEESGLTRVHLLAWRDLADPEAIRFDPWTRGLLWGHEGDRTDVGRAS